MCGGYAKVLTMSLNAINASCVGIFDAKLYSINIVLMRPVSAFIVTWALVRGH